MKFQRELNLLKLLEKKSFFLFGPRSTGKSYLIQQQLAHQALVLNLLKSDLFLRLQENPTHLENLILAESKKPKFVVIDEIQKIPELLDEVHRLIEEKKIFFLLTGSSARKLKRGHANMLAGRAWKAELFPLCWHEIPDFRLDHYLRFGGLPHIYPSKEPEEELDAYVTIYLKEEILQEGLIRKIPPFSRFLKAAALSNGSLLNFAQVGSDCGVPPATVREYYSILEDTLVGFFLEPWAQSKKRKAIQTSKFYFFDTGVTHMMSGTKTLDRNSNLYGTSFEQFIAMELRACLSYRRIKEPLTFWRSTHGFEVDFLVGDHTAIEVKATNKVTAKDLKGLKALSEEKKFKNYYLVSQDPIASKSGEINLLPWEIFLKKLWANGILLK